MTPKAENEVFGTLKGYIKDNTHGEPIQYVEVEVGGHTATTNSNGYFEMKLPEGNYGNIVVLRSKGTSSSTVEFENSSDFNITKNTVTNKTFTIYNTQHGDSDYITQARLGTNDDRIILHYPDYRVHTIEFSPFGGTRFNYTIYDENGNVIKSGNPYGDTTITVNSKVSEILLETGDYDETVNVYAH